MTGEIAIKLLVTTLMMISEQAVGPTIRAALFDPHKGSHSHISIIDIIDYNDVNDY